MGFLRWLIGGLIGGLVGVAIWVGIGYATHYEVGWIAWGIGFLVGAGVRYGAHLGNQDESLLQGVLASVMAIGAIVAAKFVLFTIFVGGSSAELDELASFASRITYDEEGMIASEADDIVTEMDGRNQKINWPEGSSAETAFKKADYPEKIWKQAEARWKQLPPKEKEDRKLARAMLASSLRSAAKKPDFGEFFSPWDFLWLGLAAVTAFKIGVGTYDND